MSKKKSILFIIIAFVLGIAIGAGVIFGVGYSKITGTAVTDFTSETTEPEWISEAGILYEYLGHKFYLNNYDDYFDGYYREYTEYSAEINGDDITWIHLEESIDGEAVSAWVGILNSLKMDGTPIFEQGSRFYVRLTTISNNDVSYLFTVGVSHPDGSEYSDSDCLTQVFIQSDCMFDDDDLKALVYGNDEITPMFIDSLPKYGIEVPEEGKYGVYLTSMPFEFAVDI